MHAIDRRRLPSFADIADFL